jgi:sugar phosphate permease
MSAITVCVHGANLMLVGTVPKKFAKYGQSSTMSGILNSAVYAGSAASAFGIAALEKAVGWKNVCVVWGALLVIALLLCFAWRKKYEKIDSD